MTKGTKPEFKSISIKIQYVEEQKEIEAWAEYMDPPKGYSISFPLAFLPDPETMAPLGLGKLQCFYDDISQANFLFVSPVRRIPLPGGEYAPKINNLEDE